MNTKILYLLLALAMLMGSCESEYDFPEPKLCVEAYITQDDYPVVCLTRSISPEAPGADASDFIVKWGKVTLSDGENTVILTGGPDKSFFPPYTYTTYEMKGEVGKRYTLTAEYDGMTVKATAVIPAPKKIDRLEARKAGDEYDMSLFLSPGNVKEYFRILTYVRGSRRPLPSFMGTYESFGQAEDMELAVKRPNVDTDTCTYVPAFRPGEEIAVTLCTIDADAFRFWREYDNAVAFGGSQFLSPSRPLQGNVEGGLGYFTAYGSDTRYFRFGE